MKLFFLIQFFIVISGETVKAGNGIKMQPTADTIYIYYDANRNRYELNGYELEYIPVNVKESSSGIYNGGTYNSKTINEQERKKSEALFKWAITHKNVQTNKNIKPNAIIEIKNEAITTSYILQSKAAINITINNYLKQLFKN